MYNQETAVVDPTDEVPMRELNEGFPLLWWFLREGPEREALRIKRETPESEATRTTCETLDYEVFKR